MVKKKATVALDKTVIIILLILTFVVLLMFYAMFMWEPTIDKEACRESVVLRGTLNAGVFQPGKKIIPLQCETEKICMSLSGECEEFGKPTRTNKVTTIKLSSNKARAQQQVMDVIANALYDCHYMLGEGNLNFMANTASKANYCLVCSRLALDPGAKAFIDDIAYVDLYSYMKNKETAGGSTYLKQVYDVERVNDMVDILEKSRESYNEVALEGQFVQTIDELKIGLQGENAIVAQILPASTAGSWGASLAAGLGIAATGLFLTPFSAGTSIALTGIGISIAAGGTTTGILLAKTFPDNARYIYPTVYSYDIESLRNIHCTSFETAP